MIKSGRWALAACSKMGRMLWTSKYFPRFETGGAFASCSGPPKKLGSLCPSDAGGSTPCESCSMHPAAPYRRDLLVVNPNQWLGQHAFLRLKRATSGCFLSRGSCAAPLYINQLVGKDGKQTISQSNWTTCGIWGIQTYLACTHGDTSTCQTLVAQPIQLNAAATPWCL